MMGSQDEVIDTDEVIATTHVDARQGDDESRDNLMHELYSGNFCLEKSQSLLRIFIRKQARDRLRRESMFNI